jgi:glycosyltransferase involved in cell wall biosynthesis
MRKVLFLSPLPPPHYGSAMSSEVCLEILKKSGDFDVHSIKLNYSRSMSDIGRINFSKISGLLSVRNRIRNEIRRFEPEIIYFVPATSGFGLLRDSFFVKQIRKMSDKKILFHVRSKVLEKDWANKRKNRIIRELFKDGSAIVLGESLIGDLHNLIKRENIYILPNAIGNEVSEKRFNEIIKKRKRGNNPKVLFLSNMDETKGWFKVLEACKILKDKGLSIRCDFVGEWPSEKESKKFFRYVEQNNLKENISYLGKKTGSDKNNILENSDILVFPTEYPLETFGRVIIEAMMFGIPVIANGIVTIPDIIEDRKTGLILKENSSSEIARDLEILTKNKRLRERMGLAGRKRFLREYILDKYSKKFLRIFKEI